MEKIILQIEIEGKKIETSLYKREDAIIVPSKEFIEYVHNAYVEDTSAYAPDQKVQPGIMYNTHCYLESRLINKKLPKDPVNASIIISEEVLFDIACNHPFIDGNKRTALYASLLILLLNTTFNCKGYTFVAKEIPEKFMVDLVNWCEQQDEKIIKQWIDRYKVKVKKGKTINKEHVKQLIRNLLKESIEKTPPNK